MIGKKKEFTIVALVAAISLVLWGCFFSGQTSGVTVYITKTGKILEIAESYLLLQAQGEPEVFIVIDKVKHWIQNPKTAQVLGYDLLKRKIVSLHELNKYLTGETFNRDPNEPTREPRDIYFPRPESELFKGLRGLLILNPLPSSQQILDLGFNVIVPYAGVPKGFVEQGGKLIVTAYTVWKDETGIIAYSISDEADCRKWNPQDLLKVYRKMKENTEKPVGTVLCGDIGCGIKGTANSKEEYQKEWIEVANQLDFIMPTVYPYRSDWPDALEKMDYFHKFYKENIGVPVLITIQAHWGHWGHLTKPNPMGQVKFWVDRGYGYIVYPWRDEKNGVEDMQAEWKKANEWAKKERGACRG